jgi:hypothetical protein
MAHIAFTAPVQCRGQSRFNSFENDQTEKYGSCATSGTAGGRSGASVCAPANRVSIPTKDNNAMAIPRLSMSAMVERRRSAENENPRRDVENG